MLLKEAHKTEIKVNDDGYIEISQSDFSESSAVYLSPNQAAIIAAFISDSAEHAAKKFSEE